MKRKNIIYQFICTICAFLGFTSCSDFLEVEPQNVIVFEKFWNEKADVDGIIAGCYSGMQSDNMLMRMMVWGEFRSDNISRGQNLDKDVNLENVLKENLTASNSYTTWDQFYNIINRCNTVIKYAPQVAEKDPSFSESELRADIAEVSALRDLCYFYLIRTFRNVPYSTEAFTDDDQTMDLPATSFDNVLDSLITDLESVKDDAIVKWPESKTNYQTGRITKQAIQAMLCEMYLWKKDYQKCIEYADIIIADKKKQAEEDDADRASTVSYDRTNGYPLIKDSYTTSSSLFGNAYNEIFGTGNSSESIFELTFTNDENMISNGAVSLCYCHFKTGIIMGYASPSSYVGDDVSSQVYSVFTNKYDARWYENILDGSIIGKYAVPEVTINFTSSNPSTSYSTPYSEGKVKGNWIIYRLTDIMLMKAEALTAMMGDEAELTAQDENYCAQAFSLVNAVNKRSICQSDANLKDTLDAKNYTTKSSIVDLVYLERQRELMFEGKRWYDLVRRALREQSTSFLSKQVLQKFSTNTSVIQSKFAKMDAIFWPYNVDELKVNKNLTQNPAFGSGENTSYNRTN